MIRVAVAGALGRMGRVVCATVANAPDLALVGGFDRVSDMGGDDPLGIATVRAAKPAAEFAPSKVEAERGARLFDDLETMLDSCAPEVVVDFTVYPITVTIARAAVERGISPVIGSTGWTDEDEISFADLCDEHGVGAALIPNFALGAVLMMRFAEEAARYFPTVEIIELHHDGKIDKPSGTAKLTARRVAAAAKRSEVPIHSVRLRGLVAHQEVLLGGDGETLTLRHDSLSRESFMSGVLLAVRRIRARRSLVIGLDGLMGESQE
jgi:4-hydroxy-tetrahydrodipicolinate reductase